MDDEPDIAENEEVKRFIAHARFKPIMVDLDEFGRVTFGPINARLFFKAATLLQITDPREFALEFTYALIKNPEITLEEWRSLSTQKLVDIVAFIVAHHDRLAPYSSSFDPTDPFPSFKASVQRYYNDAKERWDKAIQSIHYTLPKIDPNKILAPLFDLQPSWVNALAPIVESWRISQAGVFSRLNQTFFQLNIDLKAY